jgi:hypothetical protein
VIGGVAAWKEEKLAEIGCRISVDEYLTGIQQMKVSSQDFTPQRLNPGKH